MEGLLKQTKIVRHNAGAVAGTSTITPTAGIDMQGFNSCLFLVSLGVITATGVPSIKVQQSSDDGVADGYSDLEGSAFAVTDADDDEVIAVEIIRPTKRYLKLILLRTTANCVLDGILGLLGGAQSVPVTQVAAINGQEVHVSPAEGTA